ncbi:aspartate-alanine antiporter [Enterococcus sp. CSURQ0835]|uniref:aspartate-alanine antiporter n=1 Tax=Enterococcus sp. CSURQ0835 TaxID=2681394 RepID=UPI0013584C96|nr:aspartate-alanine antiporter [Enterococcus sp. CSURQ0835]
MNAVIKFLLDTPVVAIFLCLCLGYLLGNVKIKSFTIGSTVGVLVMGLLVGQLGIFKIDPIIKDVFFDLFIFAIGYEVGPAFIRSLKKTGLKIVVQSIFFAAIALVTALGLFKLFKVGPGEAAGITAGALTQSATIGTASSAISGLNISSAAKSAYTSEVAIAYALTYVFGTAGVLVFLKNIAPVILRVNLKEETKKMMESLSFSGGKTAAGFSSNINLRVFQVGQTSPLVGQTIQQLEQRYHGDFVVEEIARAKNVFAATSDQTIQANDELAIAGDVAGFLSLTEKNPAVTEVADAAFRQIPLKTTTIMLTDVFSYHAIEELMKNGIMITEAKRDGSEIKDLTTLRVGDRLSLLGTSRAIEALLPNLGYEVTDGPETDVSFLSVGIVLGILIGSIVIHAGNIPITLGTGGGALFAGLFLGWYQDRHANIGEIPAATRWFMKSVGLNLFIAVVGLQAGAQFVPALEKMGWSVLLIGAIVSIVPHLLTLLFGKFVLKLNPIDNIGSLTGAGTITAALNAINEETGSSLFALSYTPAYAVGNILLTVLGPLVVALLS